MTLLYYAPPACPWDPAHYLVSCEEARMLNPTISEKDMKIDIDDSGPLPAFDVTCIFLRMYSSARTWCVYKNACMN